MSFHQKMVPMSSIRKSTDERAKVEGVLLYQAEEGGAEVFRDDLAVARAIAVICGEEFIQKNVRLLCG
jgi:hypothetical protein